jgi:hypothetical protein
MLVLDRVYARFSLAAGHDRPVDEIMFASCFGTQGRSLRHIRLAKPETQPTEQAREFSIQIHKLSRFESKPWKFAPFSLAGCICGCAQFYPEPQGAFSQCASQASLATIGSAPAQLIGAACSTVRPYALPRAAMQERSLPSHRWCSRRARRPSKAARRRQDARLVRETCARR